MGQIRRGAAALFLKGLRRAVRPTYTKRTKGAPKFYQARTRFYKKRKLGRTLASRIAGDKNVVKRDIGFFQPTKVQSAHITFAEQTLREWVQKHKINRLYFSEHGLSTKGRQIRTTIIQELLKHPGVTKRSAANIFEHVAGKIDKELMFQEYNANPQSR